MTPYDKLKSLPNAGKYLKPRMTFKQLDAIAKKQSDLDAWGEMQKARSALFDAIFEQSSAAA